MKLTAKQRRFVEEYLIDLNATQAAIRAGYSKKNADTIGYQLLQKTPVQKAIQEAQKKLSKRAQITQERVLAEYAKIAFSDMRNVVTWGKDVRILVMPDGTVVKGNGIELIDSCDLSNDAALAVAEIKQTKEGLAIKLHDKKGALDSIARHLGMFKDSVDVNHGGHIATTEIPIDEYKAARGEILNEY